MSNLIIVPYMGSQAYVPDVFTFPAGEVSVTLPEEVTSMLMEGYVLEARLKSSDDIMTLLLLKDALDKVAFCPKDSTDLIIKYVPYARQDRVCNEGEALSAKVMANLINSMGFNSVTTYDNHSDVMTALIDNCHNIPPEDVMVRGGYFDFLRGSNVLLCSPDAGANKKTYNISKQFGGLGIIKADKVRSTKTGKILDTQVYCDDLGGKDVLVVDDICDGGYTFIKLAEKLKEKNAGKLSLYVTHGIFSKGLKVLIEAGYDNIYTTDSYWTKEFADFNTGLTIIDD